MQSRALARAFDTELSEKLRRSAALPQTIPTNRSARIGSSRASKHGKRWVRGRCSAGSPWHLLCTVKDFNSQCATNRRKAPALIRISSCRANFNFQFLTSSPNSSSKQIGRNNGPTFDENLTGKFSGASPPFSDPRGALMEFPIFDGRPPRGGPFDPSRIHWLILELDLNYVRDVWLPELFTRYLWIPTGAD